MPSISIPTPIRIAVIGAGPAGAYTAGHLLADASRPVQVDLIERLPTPWGLVRSGVAPDHPKIKTVTRVYERTAADARLRYYGNVELGRDISIHDLAGHYHAIVYATGAPGDRPLQIPREDLPGSHAATDFVGWYNAHPHHRHLTFDLSARRAIVIGNGNVALDLARMLTLTPQELAPTDTADHALQPLARSGIEEVVVVGRRGPAQASFTNPELIELKDLADVDVIVEPAELQAALALPQDSLDTTAKRNVQILQQYSEQKPTGARRRIVLRFLLSPVEILGDRRVSGVVFVRNQLVADGSGTLRARPTGERQTIQAGLVFRAIGYRGTPLPSVPFDPERSVICNRAGRVIELDGRIRPGEYVVGWIKRGPSGVIGTNKKDAQETVRAILQDIQSGQLLQPKDPTREGAHRMLASRCADLVTYQGWRQIDSHECSLGERQGRPRVKLTSIQEMVQIASSPAPREAAAPLPQTPPQEAPHPEQPRPQTPPRDSPRADPPRREAPELVPDSPTRAVSSSGRAPDF